MQPHSLHRPKSLLRLAGGSVLDHVLTSLGDLEFDSTIFVVGPDGGPIRDWARDGMAKRGKAHFVEQARPEGQAQAIALAREHLQGEVLIVFADTLVEIEVDALRKAIGADDRPDGMLFVREVEDPSALGVALLNTDGSVARLVEKPSEPVSNLAVMGLYYLRDGDRLLAAIEQLIEADRRTKGEFYLADALQDMVSEGARFRTLPALAWRECGTIEDSLSTHRYLLERRLGEGSSLQRPADLQVAERTQVDESSRLIPPVFLAEGAKITNSKVGPYVHVEAGVLIEDATVGPYVSLGAGARVTRSRVRDTISAAGAAIEDAIIEWSILGEEAVVRGFRGSVNIGDASSLSAGPDAR
jgi:glucose-1-phosphate thymidylyltransferase